MDVSGVQPAGSALPDSRAGLAGASNGTHAFFGGGLADYIGGSWVYTTDVDIYNAVGVRVGSTGLSDARGYLTAVTCGSAGAAYHVTLFAGGNDARGFKERVDLLNHKTGQWTTTSLSEARKEPAAGAAGPFAVFAGGVTRCSGLFCSGFDTTDTVDIHDVTTGVSTTASLGNHRYLIASTTLGTRVLFAGGEAQDGSQNHVEEVFRDVSYFDAATGQFGELGQRLSIGRSRIAAATIDGKAFFFGGHSPSQGVAAATRVDVFDGTSWSVLSLDLPHALVNGKAVVLPGRVVLAGGSNVQLSAEPSRIMAFEPNVATPAPPTPSPPTAAATGFTLAPTPQPPTPLPTSATATVGEEGTNDNNIDGDEAGPGPASDDEVGKKTDWTLVGIALGSVICLLFACVVLVFFCLTRRAKRGSVSEDLYDDYDTSAIQMTQDSGGMMTADNDGAGHGYAGVGASRSPSDMHLHTGSNTSLNIPVSLDSASDSPYGQLPGNVSRDTLDMDSSNGNYSVPFDQQSGASSTYTDGNEMLFAKKEKPMF